MRGLMPSTILILFINFLSIVNKQKAFAHREHKVHNIVLYPDKNSWCKTLPIKQIISYPDFKSEEIDNNVCVGACFSYSIPHTEPSDPGEVIVPYCDSCQPSETTWHDVTLQSEKENDLSTTLLKRVQIITNCSCSPCEKTNEHQSYDDWLIRSNKNLNSNLNIDDDINNNLDQSNDVPDLIDLLNLRNSSHLTSINNDTNNNSNYFNSVISNSNNNNKNNKNINNNTNNTTDKIRNSLNHKIILLLKNIQEKNLHYDKLQLIELLKMLKISDHKITHKYIEDFVETLSDDNIEMDLVKLKEILLKYDNDILLQNDNNNEEHITHHAHGHHHNQHGKQNGVLHDHHRHLQHGSHHVGELVKGHGHLTNGPHGSLVIQPDSNHHHSMHHHQHEKLLDVNPHELKPNHAGTMLSYASHSDKKN